MKLFHITCFVTDTALHDVMLFLENHNARSVEVKTVRVEKARPSKLTKTAKTISKTRNYKGTDWGFLLHALKNKPEMTKEEMVAIFNEERFNPQGGMGAAVRLKMMRKNTKGNYVAGSAMKDIAA